MFMSSVSGGLFFEMGVANFDLSVCWQAEFQTTFSTDARTASRRAMRIYVHSFSSEKERTKKADQRALPFGNPARFARTASRFGCFAPAPQRRGLKMLFSEKLAFAV
jgi:hypothetical protein